MNEFLQLMDHLTDRYTRYQELLVKAEQAIEARDPEALSTVEGDCRSVLAEAQMCWTVFEDILSRSPELEPTAIPALHRLRDLIERTRVRAETNQIALSRWMGEVGRELGSARLRKQTVQGYGSNMPRLRYLTLNA